MKINITYWLALKFLLTGFLIKAQVYSVLQADSLYAAGQYEYAATSYERVYFFSRTESERVEALFRRAQCFKLIGQNYEAYNSLARINRFDLNDSLKCVANYELAINLFLAGYFTDAEKYCAKNYNLPINSVEYRNSILLHGLVYNELNDYKKAAQKLTEFVELAPVPLACKDSLKKVIASYYAPKNLPRLKSLKKARRLSKVLPGAGLFYAGKPGKALLNIGFQLVAVGYTGANVYFANYITAASAGLFMMRSFYTGGINQLNEVVPKVNYTRSRKFNDTFRTRFITQLNKYNAFK